MKDAPLVILALVVYVLCWLCFIALFWLPWPLLWPWPL